MKHLITSIILLFFTVDLWSQSFSGTGGVIGSSQTCFSQNVSGVGAINSSYGLASVCININHPNDDELEIILSAPDGTQVPLSIQNGGSGDNYTNTCFSSTATIAIKTASAPFTGSFLPEGFLGQVNNGQNANGSWKLCIQDRRNTSNTGTLLNWSLTFNNTPAKAPPVKPPCTTNLVSGTSCATAPTICDFNGVCGKTQGVRQVWANSGLEDCFGIQNNTFVKFTASASTAVFAVWVSSTNQSASNVLNGGIQMIFFSGTCNAGPVTSFGCYPHLHPYVLSRISATGLTPGNTYYLMFDGFNNDECDFSISAQSGVNILNIDPASSSLCEGESVDLKATGGNGVYAWSPAAGLSATTGSTVTATPGVGNNTYRATSSGVGSCPIFKDVMVTVNAKPNITTQPSTSSQSVCLNGTINALTVAANAGSGSISGYQWYSNTVASATGGAVIPGATSSSYTPSSSAIGTLYYYCVVTNSNGCPVTSNVSGPITVTSSISPPTLAVVNSCGSSTLTASNFTGTLIWSDGGTGNPRTINTAGGPYTVTQSSGGCSSGPSNAVTAAPTSLSAPTLAVVNSCGSSTLTASNFTGTLIWSDGGTGNPRTINTAGGPYTVAQSSGGCTSGPSNAVTAAPTSLSAPTLAVVNSCGSSTLTASNFTGTLIWSDGGTGNPRTINTAGGPYTVTQSSGGCTSGPSNSVTAAPTSLSAPTLAVVNSCGSSTLTASNFTGTLIWSDGGTGNPRTINTAGGPYTVTQTSGGCTSGPSNAVTAAPTSLSAPTLAVVNSCGSSTLTASNFTGTLVWSDGGTGNPRTVNTTGGPYTVTQSSGGCTSGPSNSVTAAPTSLSAPTLAVVNSCGSSTLTASNFTGTLIWSDGGTGNPRTVNTAGGPYTVAQSSGGCTSGPSNAVTAAPTSLSAPTLAVVNACGSSTLTASNFTGTLIWSDGGTGNPRTINTAGGPYTVTQSSGGCTSGPSNAVTAAPTSLSAPTLAVVNSCGSSTLTASNFTGTLIWSDGGTGNPRTVNTAGGPYTVAQSSGGCTSGPSNAVSTDPSTATPVQLAVTNNCGNAILTVTGATGSLTWSDGSNATSPRIVTNTASYTVVQKIGNCQSTPSNTVTANPKPIPNAPRLDVVNGCMNSVVTASGFTGILNWSDGGTGNPRTFNSNVGPLTATQTVNGCISSGSNAVSISLVGEMNRNLLGPDASICSGQTILLNAGNYAQYLWQDNSTNQTFSVSREGTYTVTVTDNNGCRFKDAIDITRGSNCAVGIYFPSAFSPNRDGLNETFGALGDLGGITVYTLSIFDRYGNRIFITHDPYKKWDGTYNSKPLSSNNFVWMASYIYRQAPLQVDKGSLILVR